MVDPIEIKNFFGCPIWSVNLTTCTLIFHKLHRLSTDLYNNLVALVNAQKQEQQFTITYGVISSRRDVVSREESGDGVYCRQ